MPAGSGRQGQVHAKVSAMLPPEIIDNPDLSIDEKIGRLRNLDASLRSLYQALYPGETPWDDLAEIETEIRSLEQMLPSATTVDRAAATTDDDTSRIPTRGCRKFHRRKDLTALADRKANRQALAA